MSLLEKIQMKRTNLKTTKTIITHLDGTKSYIDEKGYEQNLSEKSFGFVVDTKPDKLLACIIDNQLYLGSQDSVNIENIRHFKITHILSVGIDTPCFTENSDQDIITKFVMLLDLPETNIKSTIDESISFIKNAIENDGRVLVHCNAGVSRSATIVIAYLIIEKEFSFLDAMDLVKSKRPCIQPNSGFIHQLKQL